MKPNRIILAGGSGFLGQALARHFLGAGWDVAILTRFPRAGLSGRPIPWDARSLGPWKQEFEHATVIVNLTGKSVNCRYHARNRQQILDSRMESTRVIGTTIRQCTHPPAVWLNASTATIYTHTYGEAWSEAGEIGASPEAKDAFSIEVARAWESAFENMLAPETRKIALRTAMVLGTGANSVFPVLRRLVLLGFGGKLGTGRQFVSWIHEDDYCRAVEWSIRTNSFSGPVNLAAPNPVTNEEMMQTLRQVCGRPFGLSTPRWMLELGAFLLRTETELVIKSRRVIPRRLIDSGFEFRFPNLREALQYLCSTENFSGQRMKADEHQFQKR